MFMVTIMNYTYLSVLACFIELVLCNRQQDVVKGME